MIPISRVSSGRPLSVLIGPMPANRLTLGNDATGAVVFVTDPDRESVPDGEALRIAFS